MAETKTHPTIQPLSRSFPTILPERMEEDTPSSFFFPPSKESLRLLKAENTTNGEKFMPMTPKEFIQAPDFVQSQENVLSHFDLSFSLQKKGSSSSVSRKNSKSSTSILLIHDEEDDETDISTSSSSSEIDDPESEIESGPNFKTFHETQLRPFVNKASGHSEIFQISDDKVAKPCNPHEVQIYEALYKEPQIAKFCPTYYGVMRNLKSGIDDKVLRPFQKRGEFIVLENLTHGFEHVCVLDLKMGKKNYSRQKHSSYEINIRKIKCYATTAAKLGFRLSGVRVYRPTTKVYAERKSKFGNHLSEETFEKALKMFLHDGIRARTELIEPLIKKLAELKDALLKQRTFDFMASSLLVVYEGNYSSPKDKKIKIDARLIDFDHSSILSENQKNNNLLNPDRSGVAAGVGNLIKILESLQRKSQKSQQDLAHTYFDTSLFLERERQLQKRKIPMRKNLSLDSIDWKPKHIRF